MVIHRTGDDAYSISRPPHRDDSVHLVTPIAPGTEIRTECGIVFIAHDSIQRCVLSHKSAHERFEWRVFKVFLTVKIWRNPSLLGKLGIYHLAIIVAKSLIDNWYETT